MPIPTFYNPIHQTHNPPNEYIHGKLIPYFEMPSRIETIREALLKTDLITLHQETVQISREDALNIHDASWIDYLIHISANCDELIREELEIYHMGEEATGDLYYYANIFPPRHMKNFTNFPHFITDNVSPIGKDTTWDAVTASAHLAKKGAETLLSGESLAMSLCRPPGHHAGRDFAGGYCYINNAGIATYTLKSQGRVAILDIDYHHGNGTQDIFWNDPDVLFISLHIDPTHDYPHYSGTSDEKGGDNALDTNLNYPMPPNTNNEQYLATLQRALVQIEAFQPQNLVVSMGYDIYSQDQMGAFEITTEGFEAIGRAIQ